MKLSGDILIMSPTASDKRGMTRWGRVALVVGLTIAFMATVYAGREMQWWLKQIVRTPPYTTIFIAAVARTALTAVWLLPLLIFPTLRDVGSLRFRSTWTVLLVLPFIVLNLAFFGRLPQGLSLLVPFILVWQGLATGVFEELVFRGYAFGSSPHTHPRLVVFTSAACFALAQLMGTPPNRPTRTLV